MKMINKLLDSKHFWLVLVITGAVNILRAVLAGSIPGVIFFVIVFVILVQAWKEKKEQND